MGSLVAEKGDRESRAKHGKGESWKARRVEMRSKSELENTDESSFYR